MIELNLEKELHTAQGRQLLQVAFQVKEGSLLALYGESGVGKTTILRMLAGLTSPDRGYIRAGDQVWFDSARGIGLSPQKRPVGLVFQHYALFEHLTVRQNLLYATAEGLPFFGRGWFGRSARQAQQEWVEELLTLSNLTELALRLPASLSGGQQQRVALMRALARKPRLLLLDEPLSSLDSLTRSRLQQEVLGLHRHFRMSTVLVSHDIREVLAMADQVIVLDQGRIRQQGPPATVFSSAAYADALPVGVATQSPATSGPAVGSQPLWVQGIIRQIVSTPAGWQITIQTSEKVNYPVYFQSDSLTASSLTANLPWQVGDRVRFPLHYQTPRISQIEKD